MTINKNQMAGAKKWAENTLTRGLIAPPLEGCDAAAEVIASLPDTIVDGDKLARIIFASGDSRAKIGLIRAEFTLADPAPPVEIKLGNWAMHPEHGKVLIASTHDWEDDVRVVVENRSKDTDIGSWQAWVSPADLSPVPSATPTEQNLTVADMWAEPDHGPLEDLEAAVKKLEEAEYEPQPGECWLILYQGKQHEALFWYSPLYAHWTLTLGREGTVTIESWEAETIHRLVPEEMLSDE